MDQLCLRFIAGTGALTVRAYQRILPEISTAQAMLEAVSLQNPDHILLTVENKELTYSVLSDVSNRVARLYRLVWSVPENQRTTSARLPEYNGDDSWELPIPETFVKDFRFSRSIRQRPY